MAILEFILAICVVLLVCTGVPIGVWHIVHTLRRKHRLEAEADDRARRKELAEDFANIRKELGEATTLNFPEYITSLPEMTKVKR